MYYIMIQKKFIIGHSDDQNIYFSYILGLYPVPSSYLPKPLQFLELEEQ